MNNISDLLLKYKPDSEVGKKISKELFFIELNKKLETILKPQEIQFIKPGLIKDEYLTIYCKNSIIASIIKLKEKKIMSAINELNNPFNIEKIITKINQNF
ncbi:MAG: hypothetical protein QMB51_02860 [Patescibacteria group bacterium]